MSVARAMDDDPRDRAPLGRAGGVALLIDYGSETSFGAIPFSP